MTYLISILTRSKWSF